MLFLPQGPLSLTWEAKVECIYNGEQIYDSQQGAEHKWNQINRIKEKLEWK